MALCDCPSIMACPAICLCDFEDRNDALWEGAMHVRPFRLCLAFTGQLFVRSGCDARTTAYQCARACFDFIPLLRPLNEPDDWQTRTEESHCGASSTIRQPSSSRGYRVLSSRRRSSGEIAFRVFDPTSMHTLRSALRRLEPCRSAAVFCRPPHGTFRG